MALRDALVDQARIIRRESTGVKVEGTTRHHEVRGTPFACRIGLAGPARGRREEHRERMDPSWELLFDTTDIDGGAVDLRPDDKVEVTSAQPGASGRWSVDGEPLIIRKREELLGAGYCNVSRVMEA